MDGRDWEFWLNMTNFALGAITFSAVLVVVGAVVWELFDRRARRVLESNRMDVEFKAMISAAPDGQFVSGLGLTMADGGERIEPPESCDPDQKPSGK